VSLFSITSSHPGEGQAFQTIIFIFQNAHHPCFSHDTNQQKFETGLETLGQVLSSGLYWIGA
jgi:hypothetical protein